MKKLLIGLMVLGLASAASASLITSDDFSYTGTVSNGGWVGFSGAAMPTVDGSTAIGGAGDGDARLVYADQGSGAVFASVNLNITDVGTSGNSYLFGFSDGTLMEGRFGVQYVNASTYNIGVFGAGTAPLGSTMTLNVNQSYLITMMLDQANGIHSLWVDSDGTDFATPDATTTIAASSGNDGFFLRQGDNWDNGDASWTVDNLVAATTFAEVIPEPTTMALFGVAVGMLVLLRKRTA
ncbi:MAG: PEP-CTERM sorting domain-containing protein [Kiritimatiellia bacterium]